MNTSVNRSLRRSFARAFLPKLFLLAVVAAWFVPGYVLPSWDAAGDEQVMEFRPHVDSSPAALVAEHGCWTGAAPTGVIAHHAVVTVDGSTRYVGQRLTDRAIEQAVFGVDHGLLVHAFCR